MHEGGDGDSGWLGGGGGGDRGERYESRNDGTWTTHPYADRGSGAPAWRPRFPIRTFLFFVCIGIVVFIKLVLQN